MLTYLHDARLDVALKEAFGTITRSPFTDLEMLGAAFPGPGYRRTLVFGRRRASWRMRLKRNCRAT